MSWSECLGGTQESLAGKVFVNVTILITILVYISLYD